MDFFGESSRFRSRFSGILGERGEYGAVFPGFGAKGLHLGRFSWDFGHRVGFGAVFPGFRAVFLPYRSGLGCGSARRPRPRCSRCPGPRWAVAPPRASCPRGPAAPSRSGLWDPKTPAIPGLAGLGKPHPVPKRHILALLGMATPISPTAPSNSQSLFPGMFFPKFPLRVFPLFPLFPGKKS